MCFLFAPPKDAFDCPDFIGETYANIPQSELYSIEKVEVHSANAEYGIVYDQNPSPGTKIKEGATIKLYVSLGQKVVTVPDLSAYDISRATSVLKTLGLPYEIVERGDDKLAANTVIETSPAADSTVSTGTKITIYVSLGAAQSNEPSSEPSSDSADSGAGVAEGN